MSKLVKDLLKASISGVASLVILLLAFIQGPILVILPIAAFVISYLLDRLWERRKMHKAKAS